jgi:hypothetical protein
MARGVTTEWEDIQVKMGGYTKIEKEPCAEQVWEENVEKVQYYDKNAILSKA